LLWLTLIALGSWWKNKDEEWYKNLEPAYKYNNLFFEVGDTVVRLPIPFELGTIFMATPQAMLDQLGGDKKAFTGIMSIIKSQIPNPTPSAFGPLIDISSNKNYLGIPIESEGMSYQYPTERKRDTTSGFAISLSKAFNKFGAQLSPVKIDYLLDSYSGGFFRQFDDTNIPVAEDLMLNNPSFPRRQLNEFFGDYEILQQKKTSKIITNEEQLKLNKINGLYDLYSNVNKKIKIAKKNKDEKEIERLNSLLSEKLKLFGYGK